MPLTFSRKQLAVLLMQSGLLASSLCFAQQTAFDPCPLLAKGPTTPGDPHPQPRPKPSTLTLTQDGGITVAKITTSSGCFPESDPFRNPPGTNFLASVYTNVFDGNGKEMLNTLPSTPMTPYNLHDGEPVVSKIDPTSPTDDLVEIFDDVQSMAGKAKNGASVSNADVTAIAKNVQRGIDILEGNPVPDRLYSGLSLLHFMGPEKVKKVTPVLDSNGKVIGGNVTIHQVWFDTHIESDTAFLDPSGVPEVPWTITYVVDVLSRGNDDFSPFVMYYDDPALSKPNPPLPHVAMDQTFFNMEEGTRTVFKIKMAPGKYYNLTYTWGWRAHPPRVQVTENANKRVPPNPQGKTLVEWESSVFGEHPSANKEQAIAHIGDLAPAKRMWAAFRAAKAALSRKDYRGVADRIEDARAAFRNWRDRTKLPAGVSVDRQSDLTLFYVNNTIYGEFADGGRMDFPKWTLRGTTLKVTLYNGDYFEHGYQNVDFGGARGWENLFKSSVKTGGSGCWFTFGRVHWWMNIPMIGPDGQPFMVMIPPADKQSNTPGKYKVEITYNYEPSRRLRFYQFDPIHHDVAIFSVH
jgi:hypothetical protein